MKRNSKGQFVKGTHWRDNKPFWDKGWLEAEYAKKSIPDIAKEWGINPSAIGYWIKKHGIKGRTMVEAHQLKEFPRLFGAANPMYGKRGAESPAWKGGITPERQALYRTRRWAMASAKVRKRDGNKCARCGNTKQESKLHIHHIESFANKEKRADPDNLVLLCYTCHRFVHSKNNTTGEFIVKHLRKEVI